MTVHLPTIKQLQYLVALRQHGHFGRAAEACFVTQSTLSAGLRELEPFRDLGVAVVSLAKRIEEVFTPGAVEPLRLPHESAPLQLLQRVRDEAHRFAITHHRSRRDKAMTESVLDGLPGVGPKRKRALLKHFGSPEAMLAAAREELEAVPGLPGKVAREVHAYVHKAG